MAYNTKDPVSFTPLLATVIVADRFVQVGTSGIAQCGDGLDAVGVAEDGSTATQDNAIAVNMIDGKAILEVEAGEAIAVGDDIASDAMGRAKTATSGDVVLGKALTSASAAGPIIEIVASKGGRTA